MTRTHREEYIVLKYTDALDFTRERQRIGIGTRSCRRTMCCDLVLWQTTSECAIGEENDDDDVSCSVISSYDMFWYTSVFSYMHQFVVRLYFRIL